MTARLPRSRDAPWHPRFAARFKKAIPIASLPKRGREVERQKARLPLPGPAGLGARHARECCHSPTLRARSPFGAPPRYSPRRTHPDIGSAPVPRFLRPGCLGRYPSPPVSSLPRSAETGRSAGRAEARSRPGTVCETARGNRTCSTFWTASGTVPFREQARFRQVIISGTNVNRTVTIKTAPSFPAKAGNPVTPECPLKESLAKVTRDYWIVRLRGR